MNKKNLQTIFYSALLGFFLIGGGQSYGNATPYTCCDFCCAADFEGVCGVLGPNGIYHAIQYTAKKCLQDLLTACFNNCKSPCTCPSQGN